MAERPVVSNKPINITNRSAYFFVDRLQSYEPTYIYILYIYSKVKIQKKVKKSKSPCETRTLPIDTHDINAHESEAQRIGGSTCSSINVVPLLNVSHRK